MRNVWTLTFAQFHAKTGSKVFSILDFLKVYRAYVYAMQECLANKRIEECRKIADELFNELFQSRYWEFLRQFSN